MATGHDKIEKNVGLLIVLILVVVSIGGLVQIPGIEMVTVVPRMPEMDSRLLPTDQPMIGVFEIPPVELADDVGQNRFDHQLLGWSAFRIAHPVEDEKMLFAIDRVDRRPLRVGQLLAVDGIARSWRHFEASAERPSSLRR